MENTDWIPRNSIGKRTNSSVTEPPLITIFAKTTNGSEFISNPEAAAKHILEYLEANDLPIENIKLNIAGNGIYDLKSYNLT